MNDELRRALGADADTPAGMDVGAVRTRARALRRRRGTVLAGTAAVLAAAAIVVPAGLLGGGGSGPDTGPGAAPAGTAPARGCPDPLPGKPVNTGPGLARALVPFGVDDALVCAYQQVPKGTGTVLTGVLRLSGAEAARVTGELNAGKDTPAADLVCTQEYAVPLVVRAFGGGRAVTLILHPYGCGEMTNGSRTLTGKTPLLRDLRDKANATSACPAGIGGRHGEMPAGFLSSNPGPMLPTDTTRLLLCAYRWMEPRTRTGWDAAVDGEDARSLVGRLNSSPVFREACTDRPGTPELLVIAVAPDRVTWLLGQQGRCRSFLDSKNRRVRNEPVFGQLLALAGR